MNHRLELAAADAIKEIDAFMRWKVSSIKYTVYIHYHQSYNGNLKKLHQNLMLN